MSAIIWTALYVSVLAVVLVINKRWWDREHRAMGDE